VDRNSLKDRKCSRCVTVDSTIVFNPIVDSAFLFYALTIIDIDWTIVLLGEFNKRSKLYNDADFFVICSRNAYLTFNIARKCSSLMQQRDETMMDIRPCIQHYYHETSSGFERGSESESEIESSAPIAIPINVLEFRDDGDDRGHVAVDDDQLRLSRQPRRSYSVQNPRFCFR